MGFFFLHYYIICRCEFKEVRYVHCYYSAGVYLYIAAMSYQEGSPPPYNQVISCTPGPISCKVPQSPIITTLRLEKVVPTARRITGVMIEEYYYTGHDHIYIMTEPRGQQPTVTRFDLCARAVATFGAGSGGLLIDPHPARDCVVIADGANLERVYREGSPLSMWAQPFLSVQGDPNIISMATLAKGDNIKYVTVDNVGRIRIVEPVYGDVTRKIKMAKDDNFQPCHLATNPAVLKDKIAVSGLHSNQIRLYTKKGKLTDIMGSYGNGDDALENPTGLCIDFKGRLLVCDHGNGRIVRFTKDDTGSWSGEGIITPEMLDHRRPCHVDVSPQGRLIVSVQSEDGTESQWLLFTKYK